MKQNSFQIIGRGYTCLPAVFLKIRIRPEVREEGLQPVNKATTACSGSGAWAGHPYPRVWVSSLPKKAMCFRT